MIDKLFKISVIIPTVNGSEVIGEALTSILDQSLPRTDYEVIVVDQSEDDKTKRLVEQLNKKSGSHIIYHHELKPGLHSGRNTGAKIAKADILLYCDDDIIASHNWIEEILRCFDDPNTGAAGGKNIGKWENEPHEWIKYFGKDLNNIFPLSLLDLETLWGEREGILILAKGQLYIFGCNFSVRKDLIFRMGGTPPDSYLGKLRYLSGYGETGALKIISEEYGYNLVYNPKAYVYHRVPKSRNTENYFIKRFQDEAYRSIYAIFKESKGSKVVLIKHLCNTMINFNLNSALFMGSLVINKNRAKRTYYRIRLHYYKTSIAHIIKVLLDKKLREHILETNHM